MMQTEMDTEKLRGSGKSQYMLISEWTQMQADKHMRMLTGLTAVGLPLDVFSLVYSLDPVNPYGHELNGAVIGRLQRLGGLPPIVAAVAGRPWAAAEATAQLLKFIEQADGKNGDGESGDGESGDGKQADGKQVDGDGEGEGENGEDGPAQVGAQSAKPSPGAERLDEKDAEASLRRKMQRVVSSIQETIQAGEQVRDMLNVKRDDYDRFALETRISEKTRQTIARICKMAGRIAATGRLEARNRRGRGHADYVQDSLGGLADIADAVPMEFLGLLVPELADAMDLALCNEALRVEVRKGNAEERGPIVICVDNSGSMLMGSVDRKSNYRGSHDSGREIAAKACALALTDRCNRERRPVAVVLFNHCVRVYNMTRGKQELKWLTEEPSGGTDLVGAALAAKMAIKTMPAFKRADIVMITDGEGYGAWWNQFQGLSKLGVNTHLIGIESEFTPECVKSVKTAMTVSLAEFEKSASMVAGI